MLITLDCCGFVLAKIFLKLSLSPHSLQSFHFLYPLHNIQKKEIEIGTCDSLLIQMY